jgi:hypothetical protein
MNPETEEFVELRRLLILKRHEVPPPGYFNNFSGQVIARIHDGESGTAEIRLSLGGDWFQRLWSALEARPAFAGVCAIGLCTVLVSGFISSDDTSVGAGAAMVAMEATSVPFGSPQPDHSAFVIPASSFSSTLGVVRPEGRPSLFDEMQRPQVLPVNFVSPGAR